MRPPVPPSSSGEEAYPSSPGTTVVDGGAKVLQGAVEVLQTAVDSVAGALQGAAQVLENVAGSSPVPSGGTGGPAQEYDAPRPFAPFSLPVGESSLSLYGGGQMSSSGGSGSGGAPLMLGVLVFAPLLLRRDGLLSWAFYEPPKLCSISRPALERTG